MIYIKKMGCSSSDSILTRIDIELVYEINNVRKEPSSYLGKISKNKSKIQKSNNNENLLKQRKELMHMKKQNNF